MVSMMGTSLCTGSLHFLARGDARKQSEKYPVPCVEMSIQFLGYGDHTLIRA